MNIKHLSILCTLAFSYLTINAQSKPKPKAKPMVKKETKKPIKLNSKKTKMNDTITTPSGLKYTITRKNPTGKQPVKGDKIKAHYTGTLLNGKKFDSSRDKNQPFSFNVGDSQVIQGWDEGFLYLRTGETATLIIPSELGYGGQDMGDIPPNSTLIFDVELLEVAEKINYTPYDGTGKDTITTASGLQYIIIDKGDVTKPATSATTASIHYAGYLMDGKKFDSSFDRGESFDLPVQNPGVIQGWKEMILLMNKGMKVRAILPANIAYGSRGAGGVIPPNAPLIFDMFLMDLN